MASEPFEIGDLVWAKMKGFPPWPAQISEPPANRNTPPKMKCYVYFFGSKNCAWIPKNDIFPHSKQMLQAANMKKKTKQMQSAIDEILLLSEKQGRKTKAQDTEIEANTSKKLSQYKKRAADVEVAPTKKKQRKMTKRPEKHFVEVELDSSIEESIGSEEEIEDHEEELDSSTEESIGSEEEIEDHEDELDSSIEESIGSEEEIEDHEDELDSSTEESIGSEEEIEDHEDELDSSSEESIGSEEEIEDHGNKIDQSSDIDSSSQSEIPCHPKPSRRNFSRVSIGSDISESESRQVYPDIYITFLKQFRQRGHIDDRLFQFYKINSKPVSPKPPVYVTRPVSEVDIRTISDFVKKKGIVPTKKKIGFIGLGAIGQAIVKCLLNTGHDVMVWNRTVERCQSFLEAGARIAKTPADLVLETDIIFSCLKDQEVAKHVIFCSDGVIKGFDRCTKPGKIFVEMTLVCRQTSEDFCEAFKVRRGKYLEASFYGTLKMAQDGKLIVYIAGDPRVYEDCESCFKAMSQVVKYTGRKLGKVSNVALHFLEASIAATVCEIMFSAKAANICLSDFFKLIKLSPYYNQVIEDTVESILSEDYSTKVSVNRALSALRIVDEMKRAGPNHFLVALLGLYQTAEEMNYGSYDLSSIYLTYDTNPDNPHDDEVELETGVI